MRSRDITRRRFLVGCAATIGTSTGVLRVTKTTRAQQAGPTVSEGESTTLTGHGLAYTRDMEQIGTPGYGDYANSLTSPGSTQGNIDYPANGHVFTIRSTPGTIEGYLEVGAGFQVDVDGTRPTALSVEGKMPAEASNYGGYLSTYEAQEDGSVKRVQITDASANVRVHAIVRDLTTGEEIYRSGALFEQSFSGEDGVTFPQSDGSIVASFSAPLEDGHSYGVALRLETSLTMGGYDTESGFLNMHCHPTVHCDSVTVDLASPPPADETSPGDDPLSLDLPGLLRRDWPWLLSGTALAAAFTWLASRVLLPFLTSPTGPPTDATAPDWGGSGRTDYVQSPCMRG